jgi:hypothetical protein
MKQLWMILLLFAGSVASVSSVDPPPAAFAVIIDGKKYQAKEGEAFTLPAQAVPGKSQVVITLNPVQQYSMGSLRFSYPRGVAVDDDRDSKERTVTLSIAQGPQLVLTDQGPEALPKSLLQNLRTELMGRLPSKARVLKRGPVADYSGKGQTGFSTEFTYRDEDGDEWRQRVWVLQLKGRVVSVISIAMTRDAAKADQLETTVLQSLETAP